jgi:hypothetical protein
MFALPFNQRYAGVLVAILALNAWLGYVYGLKLMTWLWPLPHHSRWIYIVPAIQGIVLALAVGGPIAVCLVRKLRPRAVLYGSVCALPVFVSLVPTLFDTSKHVGTRLIAALHACAFVIVLAGGSAVLRSLRKQLSAQDMNHERA